MESTDNDMSRPSATAAENLQHDFNPARFTYTVSDAVLAFAAEGMSLTERTVQRYCHSGKLSAVRVDPDTRHPTDRDNYTFLIDPASLRDRIAAVREREEFSGTTVVRPRRDMTQQVATNRGASRQDAPPVATPIENEELEKARVENTELKEKLQAVEIDKRVRDGMLQQMQTDRKELLDQLSAFVDKVSDLSAEKGRLEERLDAAKALPAGQSSEQAANSTPDQDAPAMHEVGQTEFDNHDLRDDGTIHMP